MPDDGEVRRLDVGPELAEVALDRLPRAAGGDPHLLVVVARRAARRERVAQPEAVLGRDRVGQVRERRRALVGGHDQVRIVAVVAHDVRGRHDAAVGDRVGDVEQAADERAVARDDLLEQRVAAAGRRRLLDHEAALGPQRDDQRVLDHLGLHQTEDLGAEVLTAVRPAQPSAGDGAAAQVHALGPRRVDEDLEARARLRDERDAGRVQLERQARLCPSVGVGLEVVGAQHRAHDRQEVAQDAVLVEALDGVDALLELARDRLRSVVVTRARGVEAGVEQLDERARDVGVGEQRLLHVAVAERGAGLAQVPGDRTQDGDVAPAQAGAQHQPVETVVLHVAVPDAGERLLEALADLVGVDLAVGLVGQAEVVDPGRRAVARADLVRPLVGDPQAHVLEHRQDLGQRDRRARAEQLAAHRAAGCLERTVEAHAQAVGDAELLDAPDVGHRGAREPVGAVGRRERVAVAAEQVVAALLAALLDQRVGEVVRPLARGLRDPGLDLRDVVLRELAAAGARDEMDPDQHRLGEAHREVDALGSELLPQDLLDALAVLGVEAVARDEHQAGEEALVLVAAHEQPQPRALAEAEDAGRDLVQVVDVDLQELVARVGLEDLQQALLAVAAGREGRARHDRPDLAPNDRHVVQGRLVGGGGIEPQEAALADHLAGVVEALDADVVQVGRSVDRRARVRLREGQQTRRPRQRAHARGQLAEGARGRLGPALAQDPEPRAVDRAQAVLSLLVDQLVVPVAQEREVAVVEPRQQLRDLLDVARLARHRRHREVGDDLVHPPAHVRPVLDGGVHIAQHPQQVAAQRLELGRLGLLVHLDVEDRLGPGALLRGPGRQHRDDLALLVTPHPDHRVDEQVDAVGLTVELHAHRVHEERHVVAVHLDHRVRGLPPVLLEVRVVDAHLRRARLALAQEAPVRERGPVHVQRVALGQVLRRHPAVVLAHERLDQARLVLWDPLAHARAHGFDQR